MRERRKDAKYIKLTDMKLSDDRSVYSNSYTTKKMDEPKKDLNNLIPKHIWEGIEEAYQSKKLPSFMELGKKLIPDALLPEKEKSIIEEKISIVKNLRERKMEEIIGEAAASIALSTDANIIVSLEKSTRTDESGLFVKVTVFKKKEADKFDKIEYHSRVRRAMPGSALPIKDILAEAISKKFIHRNDRVVCVQDESVSMGFKGMLFIFDVDEIFFTISTAQLPELINSEIIEAVITVAQELAHEGREGQHIGTTFLVGDKEAILEHTRQIIINPFRNYPEEERKITDPALKETIKSFAQLDGAFVIDQNGTIVTAGAMISNVIPTVEPVNLPGFGTRHNSAATLTKAISCIAIVVSSSGGAVRIFKDGKMLMRVS